MSSSEENPRSLKRATLSSTAWSIGTMGCSYALRFLCNIVFTYLLIPEAFGLMMVVNSIMVGLAMFSDIGLGPSIVQHKRGDDPRFLDTVFTLQIIRGVILTIVSLLLTYPIAAWYAAEDPLAWDLLRLLPVSAISLFVSGFVSTKAFTASRHMMLARVSIMALSSQIAGLVAIMVYLWISRDVMALVVGGVVSALVRVVMSHTFLAGHRNKIAWDREAAWSIISFGGWIFMSTVATFFAMQLDRLLFPKIFVLEDAGVYGLAASLTAMLPMAVGSLQFQVVFPLYSRLLGEGREVLPYLLKVKSAVMAFAGVAVVCLIAGSDALIELVYAKQWDRAGWMVSVLLVGAWFQILSSSYISVLLARGQARWLAVINASKALVFLAWFIVATGDLQLVDAVIAWSVADIVRGVVSMIGAAHQGMLTTWLDIRMTCWAMISAGTLWVGAHYLRDDCGLHPLIVLAAVGMGVVALYWPMIFKSYRFLRRSSGSPPAEAS